ncbi:MAG: GNAT family N-acetyltransferase, partial [Flavobacteriaceae bacterium]|nr:GNAT family N-acetyltransferase [Flavobacteriaceae bacterium]
MQWVCKSFKELTLTEFHHILKLRIDVFVVEQDCAYHELDGKDQKAFH